MGKHKNERDNFHKVVPYNTTSSKKQQVTEMFDGIAGNYDFLNHFMSAGIDHWWRHIAIKELASFQPKHILDIATGTGDLAIAAAKHSSARIIGVDLSPNMVALGNAKLAKRGLNKRVSLEVGDSEKLRFKAGEFDAVMVGFGVRNFDDTLKGLKEMYRVTKKEGGVVILEFSKPKHFPIKQAFGLYSRYIIPFLGKTISKDSRAYSYLPESVAAFPEGLAFASLLEEVGYTSVRVRPLTGGIATIYIGRK